MDKTTANKERREAKKRGGIRGWGRRMERLGAANKGGRREYKEQRQRERREGDEEWKKRG